MMSSPFRAAALSAFAYAVVGVVTADLSGAAGSPTGRTVWRATAWVLSFVIFATQLRFERRLQGATAGRTARRAAAAAAFGAFILAVVGPVWSHRAAGDFQRTALLSLVLWPLLVGIPAFITALVIGLGLDRATGRGTSTTP